MAISLKAARVNANLSQRKASKILGITQTTLINYEKGKTRPTSEMIKKMTELYSMPYEEIDFF